MDIDPRGDGQSLVDHKPDCATGIVDCGEGRYRSRGNPDQSLHVFRLAKAYLLRTDCGGQRLQIDRGIMRRADHPELSAGVLQEQVLGVEPRDFSVEPRAGFNSEDRLMLGAGPSDPCAVERGQQVGFAGH